MEKNNKKDRSILIVALGFMLIIAVATMLILRPGAKDDELGTEKTQISLVNIEEERGVESSELLKMFLGDSTFVLIDIRSPEEFNMEHIQNSKNIPASELAEALKSLNKQSKYVIISGGLSKENLNLMGDLFQKSGIENYFYLRGGFAAWKSANKPTVSAGDPRSFTDQAKVTYIKSDDLNKLIATDKNLFIIDLRQSGQFKENHIRDAVNIFLDNLEKEKSRILPGKKIILYDNDGLWAFKGAVRLYDLGFFNVFTLSGGLDTWKKKGYEVIK